MLTPEDTHKLAEGIVAMILVELMDAFPGSVGKLAGKPKWISTMDALIERVNDSLVNRLSDN